MPGPDASGAGQHPPSSIAPNPAGKRAPLEADRPPSQLSPTLQQLSQLLATPPEGLLYQPFVGRISPAPRPARPEIPYRAAGLGAAAHNEVQQGLSDARPETRSAPERRSQSRRGDGRFLTTGNLLSWLSISGKTYRVLGTTEIPTSFVPISGVITAASATASFLDTTATNSQRFYRVNVMP